MTGGITTPPRKKSLTIPDSPKVIRSNPFAIQNVNLNQNIPKRIEEVKKDKNNQQNDEYDEDEVEVEEDEESEEETEEVTKESERIPVTPPQKQPMKAQSRNPPPSRPDPRKAQPVQPQTAKQESPSGPVTKAPPKPVPGRGKAPPPMVARQPVAARESRQPDRRRDAPPMKPRVDEKPVFDQKLPVSNEIPKKEIDDRSKTPQPSTSPSNTLNPGRVSRFSRETDEPTVTYAVVRDKSIGERIFSSFLPGFLGGSSSTVAVTKVDESEIKKKEEEKKNSPKKSPVKNEQSAFGGLFNSLLGRLRSQKTNTKQPYVFSEEEEDVPPPPKVAKLTPTTKDAKDRTGKKRLANRYATTFDMNQLAADSVVEEEKKMKLPPVIAVPPTKKSNPFSTDSPNEASIKPQAPDRSDSPQPKTIKSVRHKDSEMEVVRQDVTSLPKIEISDDGNGEDEYVKINESEADDVIQLIKETESVNNSELDQNEYVAIETYEKAYNQLQGYRSDNKFLKKEMLKTQRKADMNIDYFVQMVEDVKYRGLEEIETYKTDIDILKSEQDKFIHKQAMHIRMIDQLQSEIKIIKQKQEEKPKFKKAFTNPLEARVGLRKGLDELKNLQIVMETVNSFKLQLLQKDQQIKNIISQILRNVDQDSEQGQILLQNLDGDYDVETIGLAIQEIFENNVLNCQ